MTAAAAVAGVRCLEANRATLLLLRVPLLLRGVPHWLLLLLLLRVRIKSAHLLRAKANLLLRGHRRVRCARTSKPPVPFGTRGHTRLHRGVTPGLTRVRGWRLRRELRCVTGVLWLLPEALALLLLLRRIQLLLLRLLLLWEARLLLRVSLLWVLLRLLLWVLLLLLRVLLLRLLATKAHLLRPLRRIASHGLHRVVALLRLLLPAAVVAQSPAVTTAVAAGPRTRAIKPWPDASTADPSVTDAAAAAVATDAACSAPRPSRCCTPWAVAPWPQRLQRTRRPQRAVQYERRG